VDLQNIHREFVWSVRVLAPSDRGRSKLQQGIPCV